MDLGAYAQIDTLENIMNENNIEVPRLRGLRLMKDENPISKEDSEETIRGNWLWCCQQACCSNFEYNANWCEYSDKTRRLERKYLEFDEDGSVVDVKWGIIHGRKRKLFKYYLKKTQERVFSNHAVWNKYCGHDDILYIHARIGGGNWPDYRREVENKPWFIEKIDDPFDSTYCDIYARIETPHEQ